MDKFRHTRQEKERNKVMLFNQSQGVDCYDALQEHHKTLDNAIAQSEELLASLGKTEDCREEKLKSANKTYDFHHKPELDDWEELTAEAEEKIVGDVTLEDLLSSEEIHRSFAEIQALENQFQEKTSIDNPIDLKFLSIAISVHLAKVALFTILSKKMGYGDSFDPKTRLAHDDKSIKTAQRQANDQFRDKQVEKGHSKGKWTEMLYQSPSYDVIKGGKDLGLGLSGNNHRLKTLGHDPILGWIFGTANILTDTLTTNDFSSYRVQRNPMRITGETVNFLALLQESLEVIQGDYLNLPAALFAQAQHLKSDVFTKRGLPIPVITVFSEDFASSLYQNQYDALCFGRDLGITAGSYSVSMMIDMILGLLHGFYCPPDGDKRLFQARTRKILLVSSSIASGSSLAFTALSKNIKTLDIGAILATVTRLCADTRFITQLKQEFIQEKLDETLRKQLADIDDLYDSF